MSTKIERLRAALDDALEGLEEMLPYVPEYYRVKWDHQGYIDRAKAALEQNANPPVDAGFLSPSPLEPE